ncbi:hypothetical protein F511_10060 [Dorcoceras hygrometricum]|uniref:Uncharacterized protein n=1 Tax=Dorcoceras hygrometricum TaxID=472368 RepID=A0A2Z7A4B3_9LAMI|nr:hypothetical protein F511_10060 [Dorcoceras hygrometricum]
MHERAIKIIGRLGTTTQLCNEISIINQNPNHSDSAGYHDSVTVLDSQHGDSAGTSRISDYRNAAIHSLHKSDFQLISALHNRNLLQDWYEMKELFERIPTLPRTRKPVARINGKLPEKLTVNSNHGFEKMNESWENNC